MNHVKHYTDISIAELVELAIQRNEGKLAANGALTVKTGKRTGRSPTDRFIVKEAITENAINWGKINQPYSENKFDTLWKHVEDYINRQACFISHVHVGSDQNYYLPVKMITETA